MGETRNTSCKETSPEKEELSDGIENLSNDDQFIDGIILFKEEKYIEAIEFFSVFSNMDNHFARQYLARCYFRLQMYEVAYKHFKHLAEYAQGNLKDYGISMLAATEIIWGNYGNAICMLEKLPSNTRNQVNLCLAYWKKYKAQNDESSIKEALRILNTLDAFSSDSVFTKKIFHLKGLIFQAQNDFKLAEGFYYKAFNAADDDISRGQILNDLGSLLIEQKNLNEAETTLVKARNFVLGKSKLEEDINDKWMEIIALKRQNEELSRKRNDLEEGIKLFDEGKYIEAIEMFLYLTKTGDILARQYLARCYHRLEKYELAYKHFQYLADHAEGKYRDYGASMVAAIEIIWGNYGKALKTLKSLPKTPRNLINLSLLYWKKYKVQKDEFSIQEALRILNKLNTDTLDKALVELVFHLKGLIYQARKDYKLSEAFYLQALEIAIDDVNHAKVLNDMASLHIEMKNYEHAEKLLFEARNYILGRDALEEAFNNKWLGILAIKKRDYETAKELLLKAVKVIREKELLREVAGIVFLLAEISRDEGFYKAADHYAQGIALERLLEEVKESDEKIVSFYFGIFFGSTDNTTSPG